MIAAFKINDEFSYADNRQSLEEHCRRFAANFSDVKCEFFCYIHPTDSNRWFFIRTATRETQKFVEAATTFGTHSGFEILTREQVGPILRRIDLNSFV